MDNVSDNPQRAAKTARQSASIFGKVKTVGSAPEPVEEIQAEEPDEVAEVETEEEEILEVEADAEVEDADEVEVEEPEATSDEVYTVRVNGEDVEVTLDELLSGYSRTSDYTRKTQELSEQRRKIEQAQNQTAQMAQVLDNRLSEVETLLSGQSETPNWKQLAQELSPQEYNARRAVWEEQQQQLQTVKAQREELQRVQEAEAQRQHEAALREAEQQLPKLIPAWQDPQVRQKESQELVDWALDNGVSQDAINRLVDPVAVAIMRKAMLHDKMQNVKPKVVKKKTKKTASAGTGVKSKRKSALEKQISQPGSFRDKVDYFKTIKPMR